MRPSYKFYIFESVMGMVSRRMAKEIAFGSLRTDISENEVFLLKRVIEGVEVFWCVCHLDGEESVCIGTKDEMMQLSEELSSMGDRTGHAIAESMSRSKRLDVTRGFRFRSTEV
jgi:hypothetical protein